MFCNMEVLMRCTIFFFAGNIVLFLCNFIISLPIKVIELQSDYLKVLYLTVIFLWIISLTIPFT